MAMVVEKEEEEEEKEEEEKATVRVAVTGDRHSRRRSITMMVFP